MIDLNKIDIIKLIAVATEPLNFTGVIFRYVDLSGLSLWRANLTDADLTGADLTRVNLTEAELKGAFLVEANLTDADLTDAILIGADLTGADLTRTDLTGADLTGADLTGAILTDTIGCSIKQSNLRKKINRKEEYNKLINTLRDLSLEELLLLFIEAKTGSQEDIDKLPVSCLETVEELGDMLNKFYADRVIKNLFK